jgi:hypothetical protein
LIPCKNHTPPNNTSNAPSTFRAILMFQRYSGADPYALSDHTANSFPFGSAK